MTNATADQLRVMATWQYRWAELAGSDDERKRRRQFANYLDRLADEREAKPAAGDVVEIIEAGASIAQT